MPVTLTCPRCAKEFTVTPTQALTRKYCSMRCYKCAPEVQCQRCGKTFKHTSSNRGKFCSWGCFKNRVTKTCRECKGEFTVKASHANEQTYCSSVCRKAVEARHRISVICKTCGKEFSVHASRAGIVLYCSYECTHAPGRKTLTCAYCGKERVMQRYRIDRGGAACCSVLCANRMMFEAGWHRGWIAFKVKTGYRTDIERLTERVLVSLAIPYMFEFKVGRYCVDFCLPSLGIALECDGWRHELEIVKAKEPIRDAYLLEKGWRVAHMPYRDIIKNPVMCVAKALGLISQ